MDMIIAELHEKSRDIFSRANHVLLSSIKLEGRDALPVLTAKDEEALARMSTSEAVLKEAHAVRVEALALKLSVLDHRIFYPTEAAVHRRLMRACQSSALAIEAEARLLRKDQGDSQLYCSLIGEARALELEAAAHKNLADSSEQNLKH
jgi:hypothetical protein